MHVFTDQKMNNETMPLIESTNTFYRRYFLGESWENILIRISLIFSAIGIVWCGMMLALVIHMKCQRARLMQKSSNVHHYDSTLSLTTRKYSNRFQRSGRRRRQSSSIREFLSRLRRRCIFWSPSTSMTKMSTESTNGLPESSSRRKRRLPPPSSSSGNSSSTPNKIQVVVETMSRRSLIPPTKVLLRVSNNRTTLKSQVRETDSSSGDELKTLRPLIHDHDKRLIRMPSNSSSAANRTPIPHDTIQKLEQPRDCKLRTFVSAPAGDSSEEQSTTRRLRKVHEFNTKATLLFHPITRRFSNTTPDSRLLPTNNKKQQKQEEKKARILVASARELTSKNNWKWNNSSLDDPTTTTDGSVMSNMSAARHLPLVMITDTSSSNTNIVEMETFEDKHRLMCDDEKRLMCELRASYRPRHST